MRAVSTDSASSGIGAPFAGGYPKPTRISSIFSWWKNAGACGPAQVLSTSSLTYRASCSPRSMNCTPRALGSAPARTCVQLIASRLTETR